MYRDRARSLVSEPPPISSISSHIPSITTDENDGNHLLTQLSTDTNVQSILQSLPMNSTRDSKRSRTVIQPKGTIPYTVGDTDTLEKVALRFNSTPSELLKLNKLNFRTIFPGQILFVPEECSSDNSDQQQSTTAISPPPPEISPSALTKHKDGDAFILLTDRRLSGETTPSPLPPSNHQTHQDVGPMVWSMARQTTARPGRVERLKSDPDIESEPPSRSIEDHLKTQEEDTSKEEKTARKSSSIDEHHHLDEECLQRFIKVHVRLMTEEHQSVGGTLLVTPNAVMFDPDVLDPLVKKHGIDQYGLIIQMDCLAGISLYEDLVMYEHEGTSRDQEKRKQCHSISVKNIQHCPINSPSNTDEDQIHDLMSSLLDQITQELNPSISTDTCHMLFNASSTIKHHTSINSSDNNYDDETSLPISTDDIFFDEFSDDLFQPLDDYKHSIGILLDDNEKQNFNRVPSQGCHLENCVPLDQFNQRFDEIDKLLYKQQQNYLAPHPIEIPYYLCIKASMHTYDIPSLYPKQYQRHSEINLDNICGKKQHENEYWFSVPKEKIDHLYAFFLRWTPERGFDPLIDEDVEQSTHNDKSPNKGFILLMTDDPELTNDYQANKKSKNQTKEKEQQQAHYLKRQNTLLKDWEIISVDEIYRRLNAAAQSNETDFLDPGIPAPKLLQPSTLINEEQSKQILLELPARVHALNWYMLFSTETHGFSLKQLYRQSVELDHDLPALLIVKDIEQHVFGAFVPHRLKISEGFYGTGESFLFTFNPDFRVFNWSGSNEFYVKGDINSLGFGSGEGTYGLWVDGDLYHGRTCPSKTFNNEILSSNEDFLIASIEVWTFID